jgi:hypothetical protein
MVKVRAWLVPPLVQPKAPEFPAGVFTLILAVPGPEMMAVVIVICNCVLLVTTVLTRVPLITPTEDATNLRPVTVRTKPCCTSANVIVLTERDAMAGAGRALPQKGSSALQPWRTIELSRSAARDRNRGFIRFIQDRTMPLPNAGCPTGRIQDVSNHSSSAIQALPCGPPCPLWSTNSRVPHFSRAFCARSGDCCQSRHVTLRRDRGPLLLRICYRVDDPGV